MVVQLLKAVHQVSIDSGDWRTASLLVPTSDPLLRKEFGGSELETQAIVNFRKAQYDLRETRAAVGGQEWNQPGNPPRGPGAEQVTEEGGEGPKGKGKGRGGPAKGQGRGEVL